MRGAIFYEKIGLEFCENSRSRAASGVISSQEIAPKISQIFGGAC